MSVNRLKQILKKSKPSIKYKKQINKKKKNPEQQSYIYTNLSTYE